MEHISKRLVNDIELEYTRNISWIYLKYTMNIPSPEYPLGIFEGCCDYTSNQPRINRGRVWRYSWYIHGIFLIYLEYPQGIFEAMSGEGSDLASLTSLLCLWPLPSTSLNHLLLHWRISCYIILQFSACPTSLLRSFHFSECGWGKNLHGGTLQVLVGPHKPRSWEIYIRPTLFHSRENWWWLSV